MKRLPIGSLSQNEPPQILKQFTYLPRNASETRTAPFSKEAVGEPIDFNFSYICNLRAILHCIGIALGGFSADWIEPDNHELD